MNTLTAIIVAFAVITGCREPGYGKSFPESSAGHQRFAVSLGGEDVGYMDILIQPMGEDSLLIIQETDWNLVLMGQRQQICMRIEAVTGLDYDLGRMSFTLDNETASILTETRREGSALVTEIRSAGRVIEFSNDIEENSYIPAILDIASAAMDWEQGQEKVFQSFDPTTGTLSEAVVKCLGSEKTTLFGDTVNATKLSILHLGTTMITWIHNGEIIREEETNFNMLISRVPPDQEGQVYSTRDLYEVFAVPSTPIDNPRTTGERTFLLEGDIDWNLFELNYPPVQIADPPIVVINTKTPVNSINLPVEQTEELIPFLQAEPMIQSDDPEIIALAESLTNDISNSWDVALKLNQFVYEALEKAPTVTLPSAVEVFESRRGDCNEHTVFFVALARAAGLPARFCAGIVYLAGKFAYHAWPMVYTGEWVSMDPTLGQPVADATHIILAIGNLEAQYVITSAMGRLEITEICD